MRDLFEDNLTYSRNLLHKDGVVYYYGPIVSAVESSHFYDVLLEQVEWKHDQAIVGDRVITTKRKVALYGDNPFDYTYSGVTRRALPWTDTLRLLKSLVEAEAGETFNACLLNLYHDGAEGMAWHSDAEKTLKERGAIGSLSFGAERKFCFKHKRTQETVSVTLQQGSLLVMKGETQQYWMHRLPPTKTVMQPRINLTFRTLNV